MLTYMRIFIHHIFIHHYDFIINIIYKMVAMKNEKLEKSKKILLYL